MRAYTPTSSNDDVGYFDLVIKVYFKNVHPKFPDGGVLSQHFDSLEIGDEMEVKGPIGHITYNGRGNFKIHGNDVKLNEVGLISGGTGITPASHRGGGATHYFETTEDLVRLQWHG